MTTRRRLLQAGAGAALVAAASTGAAVPAQAKPKATQAGGETLTIDLADPPATLFGEQVLGTVNIPDFGSVELFPLVGDLRADDKPSQLRPMGGRGRPAHQLDRRLQRAHDGQYL